MRGYLEEAQQDLHLVTATLRLLKARHRDTVVERTAQEMLTVLHRVEAALKLAVKESGP